MSASFTLLSTEILYHSEQGKKRDNQDPKVGYHSHLWNLVRIPVLLNNVSQNKNCLFHILFFLPTAFCSRLLVAHTVHTGDEGMTK